MFFNDYRVIKNINSKLSSKQKELFGSTSFGEFLNLPEFKYQGKLFHHLFMRELRQPNQEKMCFLIDNKRRRFGIVEFALMTSLRCIGDLDKNRLKTGEKIMRS